MWFFLHPMWFYGAGEWTCDYGFALFVGEHGILPVYHRAKQCAFIIIAFSAARQSSGYAL